MVHQHLGWLALFVGTRRLGHFQQLAIEALEPGLCQRSGRLPQLARHVGRDRQWGLEQSGIQSQGKQLVLRAVLDICLLQEAIRFGLVAQHLFDLALDLVLLDVIAARYDRQQGLVAPQLLSKLLQFLDLPR